MYRNITSATSADDSRASSAYRCASKIARTSFPAAKSAASFGEIYERYHHRILRIALGITRNLQDAEDVAQECFMRAFTHLETFSGRSQLSTWISRIAINTALMKIRRRRRSQFSIEDLVYSS